MPAELNFHEISQVFPYDNPRNRRTDAEDVVILITDGHPQGIHNAVSEAEKEAETLKDKNVLIIGVAVGDAITRSSYMRVLERLSSPGQTLKSAFEDINVIINTLVDKTCQNRPALGKRPYSRLISRDFNFATAEKIAELKSARE